MNTLGLYVPNWLYMISFAFVYYQYSQPQLSNLDFEQQAGCPNFVNLALRFVYGEDSIPLKEGRVAGVQTLSGTGGLRVFGEVLHQFGHKHIYVVSCIVFVNKTDTSS